MAYLYQTDTGIYYLHEYYPVKYRHISDEQEEIRRKIWAYKDQENEAISEFTNEFMAAIAAIMQHYTASKIGLVAVPPSKVGKPSPVRTSIENIVFWYKTGITASTFGFNRQIYDYGSLLQRTSDIPTAHQGVRATYEEQKASISCRTSRLWRYNTSFFILDDVTTKGTSMDVCRDILVENGAHPDRIYRLAIAKTV